MTLIGQFKIGRPTKKTRSALNSKMSSLMPSANAEPRPPRKRRKTSAAIARTAAPSRGHCPRQFWRRQKSESARRISHHKHHRICAERSLPSASKPAEKKKRAARRQAAFLRDTRRVLPALRSDAFSSWCVRSRQLETGSRAEWMAAVSVRRPACDGRCAIPRWPGRDRRGVPRGGAIATAPSSHRARNRRSSCPCRIRIRAIRRFPSG
jgi:hypothetical protein